MKRRITLLIVAALLLFASTGNCLDFNKYRGGFEPETIIYANLPGVSKTHAELAAIDTNIKSIKYGSGVTLASLALNTSNLINYYFFSNPSVDLRPYTGFYASISDGSKTKKVLLGALGTGETYLDIISGDTLNGNMETGDPPSNWTAMGAPTVSSVADERTGGTGSKSMNIVRGTANLSVTQQIATLSTGKLYYASGWAKNGTIAPDIYLQATTRFVQGGATWRYGSAHRTSSASVMSIDIYIPGAAGVTGRVDDIYAGQVLTPSALGLWYTPVNEESGWNPNAASYTLTITRN
jgi:hypothetical protein